jgi:hypothetical protein
LRNDPAARRSAAMRIIAREVTTAPYGHATGIYANCDPPTRIALIAALSEINPAGAAALSKGSSAWMRTPTGIGRIRWRLVFGREE